MASSSESHHLHPLQRQAVAVHEAFETFGQSVQSTLHHMQRSIDRSIGDLANGAAEAISTLHRTLGPASTNNTNAPMPAFAVRCLH